MHEFHGDLLVGGWAIRHLHGQLDEGDATDTRQWSGRFEIESSQEEALEVGRQYLLILDDGRNAEVVVTHVHAEPRKQAVFCDFGPWHDRTVPR